VGAAWRAPYERRMMIAAVASSVDAGSPEVQGVCLRVRRLPVLQAPLPYWRLDVKPFSFLARRSVVILSVSLACSVPALAQSTPSGGPSGAGAGTATSTSDTNREDRDYGWLGLLGLVGLLGLRRRPDDHKDMNRTPGTSR
jgi:hypothetical protein